MSRSVLATVLAALALATLVPAASAQAVPLLSEADATELAQRLAEATAEQGVCYGWSVDISGEGAGTDLGSSLGPGKAVDPNAAECENGYVVLAASLFYACGSCESEDSATMFLETGAGITNPPSIDDLRALGFAEAELLGDNDDVALFNMVSALPLLTAETGAVPFVVKEDPESVPAQDKATNAPGNDFLRQHWLGLLFFGFVFASGPAYFLYKRSGVKKSERRTALRAAGGQAPLPPQGPQQPGPPPGTMRPEYHASHDPEREAEIRRRLGQNPPPENPPTKGS